jgi:hypothetical protein
MRKLLLGVFLLAVVGAGVLLLRPGRGLIVLVAEVSGALKCSALKGALG